MVSPVRALVNRDADATPTAGKILFLTGARRDTSTSHATQEPVAAAGIPAILLLV